MAETRLQFDKQYQFCWIKNVGEEDAYVSNHSNIVVGSDNVALLKTGESVLLTMLSDSVYILGDTTVEAHAQDISDCPFTDTIIVEGGGSADVEPLSVSKNGIYVAEHGKAYSPINVNVYEKYNMLYWGNFANVTYNHFFEDARTYDELWLVGCYIAFINGDNKLCLWGSRYPIDAVYEFADKRFCMQGSDNYSWVVMNSDGHGATPIDQYGSCMPLAYIGIKNNEREQTLLWKNSETTTPNTITLSDSVFNYDEICLQFINTGNGQYNTAVWFPTSQLSINDTVYGYNDYNGYISKYTIMSGDTLSKISETGYRLYAVYGVNDSSMQETVLFTNPSDSTMPATVTLSDAYTNYDEIALIGHVINDGIKGSQYYPVKIIATGSSMQNMYSRVGIFTDTTNCWLEFTSDTTLVPDATPGMIVDKIIGIKRPVTTEAVQSAAEIITRAEWNTLTEAQKQAKGLVAIQDSSTGFMRGDFVNGADYIQSNKYIPYSDESKIISVAYPDLFDASANSWGYGTNPVLYTGTGGKPTLDTTENAVFFPTGTSDVIGYIDLGGTSSPFTAYVVMKTQSINSGRIISCFNSPSAGQMIMLANEGNIIHVDRWGDSTSLGVSATDYFVAALSCNVSVMAGYGYAYDALNDTIKSSAKTMYGNGRYLTIGRTDINPNVSYPSPTDVYVKYIAVVNQKDTDAVIENNLRALYSQFVASE